MASLLLRSVLFFGLASCVSGPPSDQRRVDAVDLGGRVRLRAVATDGVWSDCSTRQGDLASYQDCGDAEVLQARLVDVRCVPAESCAWLAGKDSRYGYVEAHQPALEIDVRAAVGDETFDRHVSLALRPPTVAPHVWLDAPAELEDDPNPFGPLQERTLLLGRTFLLCTGEPPLPDELSDDETRRTTRPFARQGEVALAPLTPPPYVLPQDCALFTPSTPGTIHAGVEWLGTPIAELEAIEVVEVLP